MGVRAPVLLTAWYVAGALAFGGVSAYLVRFDAATAERRFDDLSDDGEIERAVRNGARALRLREEEGADPASIIELKWKLANAAASLQKFDQAAALYDDVLDAAVAAGATPDRVVELQNAVAAAELAAGDVAGAVEIYAVFLARAGDAAAGSEEPDLETEEGRFARLVADAADGFAEALPPDAVEARLPEDRVLRLAAAQDMTDLGSFYAAGDRSPHAAAGLLSVAHAVRRELLGGEHPDTIQTMLLLGPVYVDIGRLADAEALYLETLNTKERQRGSNNPDLSLYLRLLAGVYERQGRNTEAEALYAHIRRLFADAYGANRYAPSRFRGSSAAAALTRPVTTELPLPADYSPTDLVPAARFGVRTSKRPSASEMSVRLARDPGSASDADTLPARLAQLMSLCEDDTDERLSLRSGYRSYGTQAALYERLRSRGTVVPPGLSEHQTGLAIDIDVDGRLMRQSDAGYQCFSENAFRFGFILSYPPNNEYLGSASDPFEPWHWRYVGVEAARLYREAGPDGRPQEFLAALPCYVERAAAAGPAAAFGDVCLAEHRSGPGTDPEAARLLKDPVRASFKP